MKSLTDFSRTNHLLYFYECTQIVILQGVLHIMIVSGPITVSHITVNNPCLGQEQTAHGDMANRDRSVHWRSPWGKVLLDPDSMHTGNFNVVCPNGPGHLLKIKFWLDDNKIKLVGICTLVTILARELMVPPFPWNQAILGEDLLGGRIITIHVWQT